jgi:hypothetical protein
VSTPSDTPQDLDPLEAPATTAALPQFIAPPSTPRRRRSSTSSASSPDPQPTPATTAGESGAAFAFPGSDDAAEASTTTTSSPASTEGKRARLIDPNTRRAVAKIVGTIARAVSGIVDQRVTGGAGAFIMRPDEADSIAAPASRLIARRAPALPGGPGGATDAADVVELVAAVFGYVMAAAGRATGADDGHGGIPQGDPGADDGYDYGEDHADEVHHHGADDEYVPAPSMPWPAAVPAPAVSGL